MRLGLKAFFRSISFSYELRGFLGCWYAWDETRLTAAAGHGVWVWSRRGLGGGFLYEKSVMRFGHDMVDYGQLGFVSQDPPAP